MLQYDSKYLAEETYKAYLDVKQEEHLSTSAKSTAAEQLQLPMLPKGAGEIHKLPVQAIYIWKVARRDN